MRRSHLLASLSGLAAATFMASAAHAVTLKAATDPSFVPFEMLDQESGEMVGFDIDILNAIGERAGFDIDLKTMDFNGIIPAVQTGSVDVAIAGITITEAREKIFDDLKAPMKAITAWLASKKGVPEPEGPTADEIEEYCNGVDADECSIDLVEQLREEASIMRKADPSGMQRWNEEYCSSDEACEAGMPDL